MDDPEKTTPQPSKSIVDSTMIRPDGDQAKLEPCLVILSGKDHGQSFRLLRTRNSFGRGKDVEIVLTDPMMSRSHGALLVDGDRIELIDFGSSNGTFLDGESINRAYVGRNARIRAGNTVMKIEFKRPVEIEAERNLYRAANTDPLTGALNRRAFNARAEQEIAHARQSGNGLSVLMCDVDHFKRINDSYGHPAGDQILKELVTILRAHIRKDDLLARIGGDEFVLLLRKTDTYAVGDWGERIRAAVEQRQFVFGGERIAVTLSMGIKSARNLGGTMLDAMIHEADAALYRAKQGGRNRMVNADSVSVGH